MREMPGVMIFGDAECKTIPRRYFFDPADGDASFYNLEDMLRQDTLIGSAWAGWNKAVMVPEGYDLTLYEKEAWRGWHQSRGGKALWGEKGPRGLVCQPIYHSVGYFKSLKIEQRKVGKVVGYWKGITSSEGQMFKSTVGLESKDSKLTNNAKKEMMNKSFSQGFSASVTASADVGFASASASVGGSGKFSYDKDTENNIAREISNTSESN
jgi:hypothetical protein